MKDRILFLTASGSMGRDCLDECSLECKEVYSSPLKSSAIDTIQACQAFIAEGVDLILFCGGDGTARDVAGIAGHTPILGIPAGVKMHSGVFAASPQAAADLVGRFVKGELNLRETEIVDVDEELYRRGCSRRGFTPWPRPLSTSPGLGAKEDLQLQPRG